MFKKQNIIDYLLVLVLIINSGFPLFYKDPNIVRNAYIATFLITFPLWFIYSDRKINSKYGLYVLGFVLIVVGQIITLYFLPFEKIVSLFGKFVFVFFILRVTQERFYMTYINLMVFFSIVSFIFYFPVLIIPGFDNFLESIAFTHPTALFQGQPLKNLVVFNLNFGGNETTFIRNSGPFWEPGAFSGFLTLAIFFNIIITKKLFTLKNVILITALITAFSTTGYICLLILIIYYAISKKNVIMIFILPAIIGLSYYSFMELEFLNEKIEKQIQQTENEEIQGNTRFGSFLVDIQDFSNNPIFGLGIHNETRYLDYEEEGVSNRNNGDTDFLVRFGITGFLLYFISMFIGFYKFIKFNNASIIALPFIIVIVFAMGFSELYFQFPFFFGLSIIPWVFSFNQMKDLTNN